MRIKTITITNFRCFEYKQFTIDGPLVLIRGSNGTGKTSLLEALHYACYIRSFRTHMPKELIHDGHDTFVIKLVLQHGVLEHILHIGVSGKKKIIKINNTPITSFKQLTDYYRIVTITQDDIDLIRAGPDLRRSLLDQTLALKDPTYLSHLKKLKSIVDQRNALLAHGTVCREMYQLWTQQLWEQSVLIVQKRIALLEDLQSRVTHLITHWFNEALVIGLQYQPKRLYTATLSDFLEQTTLFQAECRVGRSLFGAHLDDCLISFGDKASRVYASRGQQKLTALLIKIAQAQTIQAVQQNLILLVDDFMAEFDEQKTKQIAALLLSLQCQLIITSPTSNGAFEECLLVHGAHTISL